MDKQLIKYYKPIFIPIYCYSNYAPNYCSNSNFINFESNVTLDLLFNKSLPNNSKINIYYKPIKFEIMK